MLVLRVGTVPISALNRSAFPCGLGLGGFPPPPPELLDPGAGRYGFLPFLSSGLLVSPFLAFLALSSWVLLSILLSAL